jgi:hypothetical protein
MPHKDPEEHRAYQRKYQKVHRKLWLSRQTKSERWRTSKPLNARASYLASEANKRARQQGRLGTITQEWVLAKLEAGVCEVSGLPLHMPTRPGIGTRGVFTPSLDRTVPGGDYTPENVRVVCWGYNAAKGIGSHADVLKLAEALCTAAKK